MMKKVCQELVDFFENQEGWSKDEVLADYVGEILKEKECVYNGHTLDADEIGLIWGDEELPLVLQDFAEALFDKIIEGICNVIKTA